MDKNNGKLMFFTHAMNLRLYVSLAVFLFSLFFGVQFVILANGDVINNYPYISPDGFDWYMEGVYFTKLLSGAILPELPVLRPPLFVFVTAIDYLAGGGGWVLAFFLCTTVFFTYYLSLKIIDSTYLGKIKSKNHWFIVPLAIGTTFYPLNFFKPYLLADSLAVALSLASVLLLVKYYTKEKFHFLVLSIIVSVLSGMTQTYGLIPYILSCSVGFLLHIQSNKSKAVIFIIAIFIVSVLFISLTSLWRWVLPHATTPHNFDLLKVSTDMLGFYISTWGYYFLPFILFFFFIRRIIMVWNISSFVKFSSLLVVLVSALLCFLYQWPDARFTYYFWPWFMILLFSSIHLETIKGVYLMPTLMLLLIVIVPSNYWAPTWQSVRFSILKNWVVDYFDASPIDRNINTCGNDCNEKNEFLNNSDPYVNSTIKIYNQIKGL